jgi:hypothetical protein
MRIAVVVCLCLVGLGVRGQETRLGAANAGNGVGWNNQGRGDFPDAKPPPNFNGATGEGVRYCSMTNPPLFPEGPFI